MLFGVKATQPHPKGCIQPPSCTNRSHQRVFIDCSTDTDMTGQSNFLDDSILSISRASITEIMQFISRLKMADWNVIYNNQPRRWK